MARIRSIKPEFFMDDALAALGPHAQLLFAGLWCQADREGRLNDRPARLKAAILPYADIDVSALLDALADGPDPFIIRYEVDGRNYIQIVNFERHQCPNVKEPASTIPAPCQHSASTPLIGREGKGRKGRKDAREESPDEKTGKGTSGILPCLSKPISVRWSGGEYDGTCFGYIGHRFERYYGEIPTSAQVAEIVAAIREGCLPKCDGRHATACAAHIVDKLERKGGARPMSRLWLKCLREDRNEVLS